MAVTAVKRIFSKYPILANSVVYGALYTGAEFSQQTYTRKIAAKPQQDFDTNALVRFATFGTTIQANVLYHWYRWLDSKLVGTATITIIKKMTLDQFLLTPPLLAAFYIAMSVMERKSDVLEECRSKFVPTYMTSCLFWLPAQALNFGLIPPPARVVYVGACAFVWVNIVCWFKRQDYTVEEQK